MEPQNKHELLIALCFYPFCLRENPTGKGFKSMSFQTGGRRQCNVELLGCEEWCWGASHDVLPKFSLPAGSGELGGPLTMSKVSVIPTLSLYPLSSSWNKPW